MRIVLLFLFLLPLALHAQDAKRFQRALRTERAMDRWMKREIQRHRTGHLVTTPSGSYTIHDRTHDSLTAFIRRQPGVDDAMWDRCMNKIDIWPGHSTIGIRWQRGGVVYERCWSIQEGRPGTINLFGWRPHVRKSREQLKYKGAREYAGFVAEQRKQCEGE